MTLYIKSEIFFLKVQHLGKTRAKLNKSILHVHLYKINACTCTYIGNNVQKSECKCKLQKIIGEDL